MTEAHVQKGSGLPAEQYGRSTNAEIVDLSQEDGPAAALRDLFAGRSWMLPAIT
jgi:hypothetical protein